MAAVLYVLLQRTNHTTVVDGNIPSLAAGTTVCTNAAWRVQLTVSRARQASPRCVDAKICALTRSGPTVAACGVADCSPCFVPALDTSETVCSASVAPPTASNPIATFHKVLACLGRRYLGALGLGVHFEPLVEPYTAGMQ